MVAILVHGISSFSDFSPFLVSQSKWVWYTRNVYKATWLYKNISRISRVCYPHTVQTSARLSTTSRCGVSDLRSWKTIYPSWSIQEKQYCEGSGEISMIDKLIAHTVPKTHIFARSAFRKLTSQGNLGATGSEGPFRSFENLKWWLPWQERPISQSPCDVSIIFVLVSVCVIISGRKGSDDTF